MIVKKHIIASVLLWGVLAGPLPAFAGAPDEESYLTEGIKAIPEEDIREVVRALSESSDRLYDVLRQAYETNPTLQAANAELRAVEESLPQAAAGYKPTITANADVLYTDTQNEGNSSSSQDGDNLSKEGSVSLKQPLYRGGRTASALRGARNSILAQSAAVDSVRQKLMLDVATAYMDVLRDRAWLNLSENNKALISRQLEATKDRFEVGELTRTDVSQAQAREAGAVSDIISAKAKMRSSVAVYEQIVGSVPDQTLLYPDIRFSLPETLEEALSEAAQKNPSVLSAEYKNAAAEDDVDTVFGELLPEVSLTGGLSKSYDPQPGTLDETRESTVGVSASIPLYQAGSVRSRVRQAKQTANQRFIQIMEARRRVRAETISSWENLAAAKAEIISRRAQVEASAMAQEGVRYESDFGERTILDALDADQEYLDAQVGLVSARRNEIVARFSLAAVLGRLTPEILEFSSKKENEEENR